MAWFPRTAAKLRFATYLAFAATFVIAMVSSPADSVRADALERLKLEKLKAVQHRLGVHQASERVERALATIACGLAKRGVRQLVVAGGETSGSVVQALQMHQLQIGSQIDPGVPWCAGRSEWLCEPMLITLKSGNFGAKDFFSKAFRFLDDQG